MVGGEPCCPAASPPVIQHPLVTWTVLSVPPEVMLEDCVPRLAVVEQGGNLGRTGERRIKGLVALLENPARESSRSALVPWAIS